MGETSKKYDFEIVTESIAQSLPLPGIYSLLIPIFNFALCKIATYDTYFCNPKLPYL